MSSGKRARRRRPSPTVRQLVLLEAGYKCANPRCRHIITLEIHHIVWVRDSGSNDPENLLALCPNCHSLHTSGHISLEAIRTWKSLLSSLNNPHRASADLLLVLYEDEKRLSQEANQTDQPLPFRFTGDGLAMLSGLIVSGLVEISRRFSGAAWFGGGMPSFEVRLTERGNQLVEAWLSGHPDVVAAVLSDGSEEEEEEAEV